MPLGHHKNSLQRQQPRLRGSRLAQVWNAPETLKWFQQCCQTNLPAAAIDLWPITGNPAAPLQPAAQAGNIKTCTRYRQLSSWEVQSPYSPPRLYNLHAHGYWTRRLISCGRHPIVLIVQRKAWYCGNLAFICHSSWCHLYRWDCQNNLLKLDNSWSQNATLSCIDLSDSTWVSSSPQFPLTPPSSPQLYSNKGGHLSVTYASHDLTATHKAGWIHNGRKPYRIPCNLAQKWRSLYMYILH